MQVISWSVTAVERKQILGVGMLLSRSRSPLPVIQPQVVQYTKFLIFFFSVYGRISGLIFLKIFIQCLLLLWNSILLNRHILLVPPNWIQINFILNI